MTKPGDVNWKMAVMWHGVDVLPRLRRLDPETRMLVMREAEEHSLLNPLWLDGPRKKYAVPAWGDEKLTGAQVAALMVFGLWVHVGEREEMCGALMRDWPIREALIFSPVGVSSL